MRLTFHGARGSFPVAGPNFTRFGGQTTCLELRLAGLAPLVIDGGSGARELGRRLLAEGAGETLLLMTHLHWDHTMGLPFFGPLYAPGWLVRLGGWPRALAGLAGMFGRVEGLGRFPVEFGQLAARIVQDPALAAPRFKLGPLEVRATPLNHPQGAIGLRFEAHGRALAFISDNELDPATAASQRLPHFCQGVDVLVHDAQFEPDEMPARKGWGHSDWRAAVELARAAGVGRLILTHHDPDRVDDQVEAIVEKARRAAGPRLLVQAAHVGLTVEI